MAQGGHGPARPLLRHRRRGRLDPHRRGPHAADHLGAVVRGGEPLVRGVREDRPHPRVGCRLRGRREEAHRRRARTGHREGRGLPRHRQPLRVGEHPAHLVPQQLDQGAGALQARQRLRRDERRGDDRRRAHRAHPRRASLQRGHPPGDRGEGGRSGQGREPDPRHRHAAELLPPVRQARRHDRYGRDRGRRVHVDVQARRRADPHQQADDPQGSVRPRVQERGGQVRAGGRRHRRATQGRSARARRNGQRREERVPLAPAGEEGHQARGPEREESRSRGRDRRPSRASRRGHRRDQHGRPWYRHHARRQRRVPRGAGDEGEGARPARDPRRVRGRVGRGLRGDARTGRRRGAGRARGRRSLRAGNRAPRVASHRQPAARTLGAPGRPR